MPAPRPGPIFIVASPRSGTSLLRNLLNRHPAIGLCDETYFFYYVHQRRRAFGDLADERRRARLIGQYLATRRVQRLGMDAARLAETLQREGDAYPAFLAALLQCYAAARGKRRWGEKTPDHAEQAATLCDWFPDCALLHIVRDPRDVVGSLLRMPWGRPGALANARWWRRCVESAHQCRARDNYLLVSYERLAADPSSELRRICDFVGEDYVDSMLTPDPAEPAHKWWFDRARNAVRSDRVNTWRAQLTPRQVALVEAAAGPFLAEFGYEPSGIPLPAGAWIAARAAAAGQTALAKARSLPRMYTYWLHPTRLAAEEAWIESRLGQSDARPE